MTNEIQQTRYDRIIRRVAGIIGPGSKVAEVITELFPMIDVERVPGELLILGGYDICFGAASLAGGVGNQAKILVLNPIDSGKLLTVSGILISSDTTQIIRVSRSFGVTGNRTNTELFRDLRRGAANRPVGQLRSSVNPVPTAAEMQFRLLANQTFTLENDNSVAVLPPDARLVVGTDTADTLLNVTFFWRERQVEQSELSV